MQQDVNALVANRQYWTAKLDRVVLYFPMIEAILIDEDVPTDFKYLAVQESSLTPDAVSSSTAVGYWQFKRETATDNGMRVDDEIDERKSITGSTTGAAKYLKKNNAQFNNWIAVAVFLLPWGRRHCQTGSARLGLCPRSRAGWKYRPVYSALFCP